MFARMRDAVVKYFAAADDQAVHAGPAALLLALLATVVGANALLWAVLKAEGGTGRFAVGVASTAGALMVAAMLLLTRLLYTRYASDGLVLAGALIAAAQVSIFDVFAVAITSDGRAWPLFALCGCLLTRCRPEGRVTHVFTVWAVLHVLALQTDAFFGHHVVGALAGRGDAGPCASGEGCMSSGAVLVVLLVQLATLLGVHAVVASVRGGAVVALDGDGDGDAKVVEQVAVCLGNLDFEGADACMGEHRDSPGRRRAVWAALRRLEERLRELAAYLPQGVLPLSTTATMAATPCKPGTPVSTRCGTASKLTRIKHHLRIVPSVGDIGDEADDAGAASDTSTLTWSTLGTPTTLPEAVGAQSSQISVPQTQQFITPMSSMNTNYLKSAKVTLLTMSARMPSHLLALNAAVYVQQYEAVLAAVLKVVASCRGVVDVFTGSHISASFNASRPTLVHHNMAANAIQAIANDVAPTMPEVEFAGGVASASVVVGVLGTAAMRRQIIIGKLPEQVGQMERYARMRTQSHWVANMRVYDEVCLEHPMRILLDTVFFEDSEHSGPASAHASRGREPPHGRTWILYEMVVANLAHASCRRSSDEWMYEIRERNEYEPYNEAGKIVHLHGLDAGIAHLDRAGVAHEHRDALLQDAHAAAVVDFTPMVRRRGEGSAEGGWDARLGPSDLNSSRDHSPANTRSVYTLHLMSPLGAARPNASSVFSRGRSVLSDAPSELATDSIVTPVAVIAREGPERDQGQLSARSDSCLSIPMQCSDASSSAASPRPHMLVPMHY